MSSRSPLNSSSPSDAVLARWQRRLGARLARPQPLFLSPEGVQVAGDKAQPWADWCRLHAGQAADLTVSTALLHELVCEPGLPLEGEAQLQAYARQLLTHYFGAAAKSWPLASWRLAAREGVSEQCGASALHGGAAAALLELAATQQVHLARVQPAWAPVLRRLLAEQPEWARAPSAALAWVEGQVLTWLPLADGRLQDLRQLRLAAPTQAALAETLYELCATAGAPETAPLKTVLVCGYGLDAAAPATQAPGLRVLGRLDGKVPPAGCFDEVSVPHSLALPRPDFLGPRAPRSRLAWPLAGLGGLALLATAGLALHSQQSLKQAEASLQQARAEARPATRSAAAPQPSESAPRSAAAKSAEAEALRGAAEVQGLLLQPWQALLANVEQAGAGAEALSWLTLDFNAARQELRLEGLAADKLQALQMVDRLSAAPGWQGVMLSRFQAPEPGLQGQRFELQAKLKPAALHIELPPKASGEALKP